MCQTVANRVIMFLNDDASDSEFVLGWQTLPGQLVFTGRTKPLPIALLINLSTQCRNRYCDGDGGDGSGDGDGDGGW